MRTPTVAPTGQEGVLISRYSPSDRRLLSQFTIRKPASVDPSEASYMPTDASMVENARRPVRRAPEEQFEQVPVRLERAHHEPDPAGPVGRQTVLGGGSSPPDQSP